MDVSPLHEALNRAIKARSQTFEWTLSQVCGPLQYSCVIVNHSEKQKKKSLRLTGRRLQVT